MSIRSRVTRLTTLISAVLFGLTSLVTPPSAFADTQAVATEQVYVRAAASTDAPILGELWGGDVVWLTGYEENGFYELWYGDYVGYAYMDYISLDSVSTDDGTDTAGPDVPAEPAPPVGNGAIVDFAMQYLGYPYVWAGASPSGFDCSGFTQYVVQNVLGYTIPHYTDDQATVGTPVEYGQWAPGDLIFFTGTAGGGYYSHVGIYIGDGNMIHAENPSTGVVISSLYSDYYSAHYAMAKRL